MTTKNILRKHLDIKQTRNNMLDPIGMNLPLHFAAETRDHAPWTLQPVPLR